MSKISPIQAQALGLKPVPAKVIQTKPAVTKAATPATVAAKPAAKSQAKTTAAKTASAKAIVKPATKASAKPAVKQATANKTNIGKKDSKKDDKKAKPEKIKMERDSFTMPKDEYAQLTLLKARLTSLGQPAKKSELLRAGVKLLAAMSDNTLKTTLAKIPVIKTGRPNKKS